MLSAFWRACPHGSPRATASTPPEDNCVAALETSSGNSGSSKIMTSKVELLGEYGVLCRTVRLRMSSSVVRSRELESIQRIGVVAKCRSDSLTKVRVPLPEISTFRGNGSLITVDYQYLSPMLQIEECPTPQQNRVDHSLSPARIPPRTAI